MPKSRTGANVFLRSSFSMYVQSKILVICQILAHQFVSLSYGFQYPLAQNKFLIFWLCSDIWCTILIEGRYFLYRSFHSWRWSNSIAASKDGILISTLSKTVYTHRNGALGLLSTYLKVDCLDYIPKTLDEYLKSYAPILCYAVNYAHHQCSSGRSYPCPRTPHLFHSIFCDVWGVHFFPGVFAWVEKSSFWILTCFQCTKLFSLVDQYLV